VVGIFTNVLLSVFGFILLFPALLTPSKKPPSKTPSSVPVEQKTEEPTRFPSPSRPAEAHAAGASPMMSAEAPYSVPYLPMSAESSASSALFPNTMFPTHSLGLPAMGSAPAGETKQGVPEPRDELLEFGLILAVLKLISG